ncbi:ParB/RepB/Spo0J family partition protein [Streptomyces sp. ME02-6987-2C]|uniref:ParB/RepB/Spo0J family partition protein n=1 Tax=unclassified Streptomyces TaxID=2593676 RepID=UPI0029A731E4|nr:MULTISPECIES: ParB/RepB/Spo0J family partition protein [unclassified Streptomyces]MDX3345926.1 ParB/RepB/Spo0J family partition protein [Streptomyces sp. ME02-6979A]MDX3372317.1 ParB/RepB/Spo0J family partition protein [Streptomyces sp. ME02-6987-2C]MDX3412443.1 ParB/RepB/Spo0J family partition protein [Streptomyces sp. ME02-6977A]MDX3421692.1 ParB/RepB/Spo0J family partition protein [Streptomyces sp. ME02-6985-2c]
MAEIEITHTRAEGTILTGSSKGDGVFEIVRPHGFWFSRHVDGLFIKRSRDRAADTWTINRAAEALRAAGHTVTVEINERARRSFSEAEADREERAEDRADRYSDRAGRAAASSEARYQASKAISDHMTGEPIKIGHHSEGRHRRDIERMDGHMRAWIQEGERSTYWSDRARVAGNYERFRKDPYRTLRRLKKLRADLRQQERYATEAAEAGRPSERHEVNVLDLREEIEHWEAIVKKAEADGVKIWGPDDFAPGDYVHYSGSWYQVKRVNPATLSIAWNLRLAPKQVMTLEDATTERGQTWTHPADYTNVRARCPEAAMDAWLADGKVPGAKAAREASEAQPATAVRAAQAAKPKTAKKATRSDPKVAKRVFVACDIDGDVAALVLLNGNSRPHKGYEPVKITAPEGERFHRAVWSKLLQGLVAEALAERGYKLGPDDWTVSRDRTGFVRSVRHEPEQPAEAEAPRAEAPAERGEAPGKTGKPAVTCDSSGVTRNRTADSRVGISDDPLTQPPQEEAVTEEREHGRKLTRRERQAAQVAEMQARAAERPEIERTAELDAAYRQYVDDGIAATDGWHAPLDFQAWASTLGAPLVAAAAAAEPAPEVEVPAATAEVGEEVAEEEGVESGAMSAEAEKLAVTCDSSETTRNHAAGSRVGISDYTLNYPTQEVPAMTASIKAPKTAKSEKKAPAPKKAAPKVTAPAEVKAVQRTVPIDRIDRDESQPRKVFDPAKLEELAGSIKELGLVQPVSLRYVPSTKRYVLIAGERRWRASKLAGLTEMPAVVNHGIEEGSRETLARQVAENVGRADMTPIEEAESFERLVKAEYSIDEVAKMVGKSPAYVGWRIDLLRLTEPLREALAKGHIQVGLAWYVSLLNADNQMRFLVRHTRGEFKSVRDAEAFAQAARAEEKRQEEQGSFFVLSDEATENKDSQEAIPGSLDLPESEREKLVDDRRKLVGKIDKLSLMGEILSELASADPETLAVLLAGTPGGVPGHQLRIEHLRELTHKAHKNLRQAQAIAAVRAGSIAINPEAASSAA